MVHEKSTRESTMNAHAIPFVGKDRISTWRFITWILLLLLGAAGTYAVTNYKVSENTEAIKELRQTTVPRTEFQDLKQQMNRMEQKIDRTDEHILQHIQRTSPR